MVKIEPDMIIYSDSIIIYNFEQNKEAYYGAANYSGVKLLVRDKNKTYVTGKPSELYAFIVRLSTVEEHLIIT